MVRIAIVDDETFWLDKLEWAIRNSAHWYDMNLIIDRFTVAQSFVDSVMSGVEYGFMFLDIHIPDIDGITAFHQLPSNTDTPVIFVSTHTEELPSIYKLYPAAFLHKPYEQETFERTIKSVLFEVSDNARFEYQIEDKSYSVQVKDILCFSVVNHNVTMRTITEFRTLPRKSLDTIEEELSRHGFFRCHRSYMINMRYYHNRTQDEVTIKYKDKLESLPLSKNKKSEIDRACFAYNTEGEYAF